MMVNRIMIYSFVRPKACPICHRPYKVDEAGRCKHCGAFWGGIKF